MKSLYKGLVDQGPSQIGVLHVAPIENIGSAYQQWMLVRSLTFRLKNPKGP
jgi:hypothetical protein